LATRNFAAGIAAGPAPGTFAGYTPRQRAWATLFLLTGAVMNMIDTTIANVALPQMQGTTGASREEITWVLTSYIIAMAVATPLGGWLGARFSRKTVLISAIAGFTACSFLCGVATTVEELVAFRVLQGLSGAPIVPIIQAVMLDIYPPKEHGKSMALFSLAGIAGPLVGPVLGGWLTANYSWGWVFLVNLPVGMIAILGLSATMRDTAGSDARFDLTSYGMLALAVATFQLMLDRGGILDWFDSTEIRVEAVVAAASLAGFIIISMGRARPLIPRRVLLDRNFIGGTVLSILSQGSIFAVMALLPELLAQLYGYPALQIGIIMAPRGAGTLMAALVAPMMVTRFGPTRLMVAGVLMLAAGGYILSWLTLDASATLIVVSGAVQGAGSCLLWVPMTLVIYRTIPPDLRSQAAGFNTLARYMASAVGITAIQTYTIRLAGESHAQFVDRLQLQNLPSTMNEAIATGGSSAAQALSAVNAEVTRQATMAAYVDVFAMMSVGMLLMLPMLLLLRRPRPGPG